MIQQRYNVFETNSSSMHSLVIKNDNAFFKNEALVLTSKEIQNEVHRLVNDNGRLNTYDDDWYFGRAPFRILSSFIDKMKYAFASGFSYNEILAIVQKYIPTITEIKQPKYMGTDEGQLKGWLEQAGIDLETFLINKKYIIICDGDESCIWDSLKDTGIIDKEAFEEI